MDALNGSAVYGFFSFFAGFVSMAIAIGLCPHWKNKSARILMLLMTALSIWSLAYGMEFISPDMETKLWWVKIEYFGVAWVGPLLLCFVRTMSDQAYPETKIVNALLRMIPIAVILLVLSNDSHHLMWQSVWLNEQGHAPVLVYSRGPVFWGFVVFSYALILLSTLVLVQSLRSARGMLRKQVITVSIGVAIPWLSNIVYLFGFEMLEFFDLTPIAFTIGGVTFAWGLLRYQMLGIIPLAHEAVIESMGDPVIALDMDDRILTMNTAAKTLVQTDQSAPGKRGLNHALPGLFDRIRSFQHQEQVEIEIVLAVHGQSREWNLRVFPLLTRKQKQTGRLVVLRDITDRKIAETALKESERIHRIMLEASPNPIVYYNEAVEVTYLNPAFTRVFGWYLDELLGEKIDFIPEQERAATKTAVQNAMADPGGHHDFISRRYTRSGDLLDVSIHFAFSRSRDGSAVNMVVNYTDITQIKEIERELTDSKNFTRTIINSMPSLLIGLNATGLVTAWNAEAHRLTGIPADKAEGRLLRDIFPRLSDHVANVGKIIEDQRVREKTKVTLVIAEKRIQADITIYPIVWDRFQGAVIRVDDISERVRIEEMMVQSEKMASIGGLAAGMAHEINNPLAGILQNIQVIRNRLEKNLPANIKAADDCGIEFDRVKAYMEQRNIFSMMELVMASGQRAAHIVANMLSFSRKSNHRKSMNYLDAIMEATIELIENDYQMKKQYDFRAIEIIKTYTDHTPPILCEKSEIQQVFLNILKNGAEAMAEAGTAYPRFEIRCFRRADQVIFEIQDNGPGLDREIKKRIFEPFFTTKEVGIGTGLGLSVSYFIITENHEGHLSVESAPEKGTTFIVSLPIAKKMAIAPGKVSA